MRLFLLPITALLCLFALSACTTSRMENGAALAPGESATLRLYGPRARFELRNIGNQPFDYTVAEPGATSGGILEPGSRIAESRHDGDLTLTITNPGPNPAQAMIESKSRGGMEFNQPGN